MKKKGSGIMNKFIDSKASYVDLLIDKYNPPSNPKCVVDYDVKGIVESRLGVCLPEDYYEYINAFGYGSFDNYVKVVNFFHKDGIDEYFQCHYCGRCGQRCEFPRFGEKSIRIY